MRRPLKTIWLFALRFLAWWPWCDPVLTAFPAIRCSHQGFILNSRMGLNLAKCYSRIWPGSWARRRGRFVDHVADNFQ